MPDQQPYCDYRMTVRVEIPHQPGQFARLATILADENANLGARDIVEVKRDRMVRDITFDAQSQAHADRVMERLRTVPEVRIISASDRVFLMHLGGKIHTRSKVPVRTRNALSMLLKEFADIDGWPLCLATQDPEAIVRIVEAVAPTFGGINLEDISAPRCFDIEERLKQSLDIPVMHDDQHGTAVVVLAALLNALKVVGKQLSRIKVVVNGLGAAGTACCRILLAAGVRQLIGCDQKGAVLHAAGDDLKKANNDLRSCIHHDQPFLTLRESLRSADVFVGVSASHILKPKDLQVMASDRIVFAMANPDAEIEPAVAAPLCRILATGRSDYPNQVNNLLAFPGIFRGALDVRARAINEPMKLAAAHAIANVIPEDHLSEDYIVPGVFDKRIVRVVARAVAHASP